MDSDSSGLKLIAAHLAQVKLDAAENKYAAKVRITQLERDLLETSTLLESARADIQNYQVQVKQLQHENTYKALVAERSKWKSLIDTLRKDKAQLKTELEAERVGKSGLEQEKTSSPVSSDGNLTVQTTKFVVTTPTAANGDSRKVSNTNTHSEFIQLQGEVKYLQNELYAKDVEINALRAKLDRELELKWEREHSSERGGGWKKSLLESFAEVLAPYPEDNVYDKDPASYEGGKDVLYSQETKEHAVSVETENPMQVVSQQSF
mmetsp:Transcript_13398/g.21895  ORF Transcript_13398/g.21895 Transcript_13398/m.21895 type:complete len:264 (-) Transcript_13398:761-1552(-)|eukprot:CAMPEP_0203748206 /NCGR_PEP_ID=MMETSP0098-20131031/3147_1 /ASSEMBLY_ACC=CAM_ASM_000208 /TAXON_ID=96639 /ORGANISM=" , Strain NY0313808BC1" /LENGTH=263 /DNA_ID=CAMNT_0050636865 /DNA_START=793 /DNA_END=1584 /DNA_ORIENTATION=-